VDKVDPTVTVRFWGEWACFTRPENKAERVSYEMPTPTAARGLLEAIFWKPQFQWQIEEIWLLNPVRTMLFVRNELTQRQSHRVAQRWAQEGGGYRTSQDRVQRGTLALRDVNYLIRARVAVKPGVDDHPHKYRDQFLRRVERGQRFRQPYFGLREFAADFDLSDGTERPLPVDRDLGWMLHSLNYQPNGTAIPCFFRAELRQGVMQVPGGLDVNPALARA
jgi:CRISPR-associated protein Cas5d